MSILKISLELFVLPVNFLNKELLLFIIYLLM